MSVRVCPHRALSSASTSSPAQRSTQTAPSALLINRSIPVGTTLRDREKVGGGGVRVCLSVSLCTFLFAVQKIQRVPLLPGFL